ncbi:MAG: dicarboxylate/amino acid:cation symporter, partial [Bacilli bacterium]|nr:dicarboxylate/amino acid:cation symporter [Bacilli bacterium]
CILICFVLGIFGGIFIPKVMLEISFLGNIYINLLKFIIIPTLFTSIMVSVYKTINKRMTIFPKTIILFILMFVTSFIITSVIVALIKPGVNFDFDEAIWSGNITKVSLAEFLVNIIPNNIVTMVGNNNILACIIFAFVCGFAAAKVDNGKKAVEMANSFKNIFDKILEYIMYLTPLGVFSLIGNTIANYGIGIIGVCSKYIIIAYLCCIIVMFLVMILPVWVYAKISPLKYIKEVSRVWLVTLSTCSSLATLPHTIKVCNDNFGIPNKITDLVVPLGCTINMCGGAVSFALLGLFCSQLYGIEITFGTYLAMLFASTLINMATPGIPGGGIVIGATYLSVFGIPLSFMGVYSGIYRLLDMAYTTMNVTGDITANILISKAEHNSFKI